MFQLEWGNKIKLNINDHINEKLEINKKSKRMLLCWEEHCLECAPPLCYQSCPKFLKRVDSKCKNFDNGISLIEDVNFGSAVHIKFRDWAKLEAICSNTFLSYRTIHLLDKLNLIIIKLISWVYFFIPKKYKQKRKLNGLYYIIRDKFVLKFQGKESAKCILKLNIILLENEEVNFRVETQGCIEKLELKPGKNNITKEINTNRNQTIKIFPENNFNASIVILDLAIIPKENQQKIVKCVIWDLDNTIWEGILIEGEIKVREEIIDTIKELDSRGIINSISSKNNHEEAELKLKEIGIWQYFVYPKINWEIKSKNILEIVNQLNIGLDSIIFIDDNEFERQEVKSQIPNLNIEDENFFPKNTQSILQNLPLTIESQKRRESYKTEELRKNEMSKFTEDFMSFLYSCDLFMEIKTPSTNHELERALELLSRTNQLNLSTRRYSAEEFNQLISSSLSEKFIFSVRDKFGDYGIVGFIHFRLTDEFIEIIDLVISCRVVQKMVENSLIDFLFSITNNQTNVIKANYVPTIKNGPIFNTFINLGFRLSENNLELHLKDFSNTNLPVRYSYVE
jgi:FkbH-like protein